MAVSGRVMPALCMTVQCRRSSCSTGGHKRASCLVETVTGTAATSRAQSWTSAAGLPVREPELAPSDTELNAASYRCCTDR